MNMHGLQIGAQNYQTVTTIQFTHSLGNLRNVDNDIFVKFNWNKLIHFFQNEKV